jgi:hypothetical protein
MTPRAGSIFVTKAAIPKNWSSQMSHLPQMSTKIFGEYFR